MQMIEIQRTTEARCRQIRKPDLPYMITVCYWVMYRQSYNNPKRYPEAKVQHTANVMNRTKANRMPNLCSLPPQQCIDGVAYYKGQIHTLRLKSRGLRRVHLRDRVIQAQELGKEEGLKEVQQVTHQGENTRMWHFINRMTDDAKSG